MDMATFISLDEEVVVVSGLASVCLSFLVFYISEVVVEGWNLGRVHKLFMRFDFMV